jgi:lipooligosaccharide transport system permease protein
MASYGLGEPGWLVAVHVLYLGALGAVGIWWARRNYAKRMGK